jgi:C1A family cysteine protease
MLAPMMTVFLISCLFNVVYSVSTTNETDTTDKQALDFLSPFLEGTDEWTQFIHFQDRFNKLYNTPEEYEIRFHIFRTNLRAIILHNLDETQTFTMGLNQFTDLTAEEFNSYHVATLKEDVVFTYNCKSFDTSGSSDLPLSVDWRTSGAVTSVKDQGQCGSCWSFSSTGAIEGAWAISRGELIDLSEQQLVDCATGLLYGSRGCNGGQMDGAFKYVIENGQCAFDAYPYTATDGLCNQKCTSIANISYCLDVKSKDQLSLKAAVALQPVSVAIEADTRYFQSYSSGILTSTSCGTNLDHGVLVVGYGVQDGQQYWLVKNSWGTTWGDKGYLKIARSESTNDAGVCGIAMQPSFPSV